MRPRLLLFTLLSLCCAAPLLAQFEIQPNMGHLLDQRRRAKAKADTGSAQVTKITVESGGLGYSTPPRVVISPPPSGGVTAAAIAVVSNGAVSSITITQPGSGYTAAPLVIIDPPVVPAGPPALTPQFAGMSGSSGGSAALPSQAGSPAIKLAASRLGNSFAAGAPRYSMGAVISPPLLGWNSQPVPAGYWRELPVRPGEVFSGYKGRSQAGEINAGVPVIPAGSVTVSKSEAGNKTVKVTSPPASLVSGSTFLGAKVASVSGDTVTLATGANETIPGNTQREFLPPVPYYYSPHARKVFASQPGQVVITWISAVPDLDAGETQASYKLRTEVFSVSTTGLSRARTIFWTENGFDAKPVTIPTGRITQVNVIYNSFMPSHVVSAYVPVGSNPGAVSLLPETRTLWFENMAGQAMLRAFNQEGRVLIEYLGEPVVGSKDGTHVFLGADLVDVQRVAPTVTIPTLLGEELRPQLQSSEPADLELIPDPVLKPAQVQKLAYGMHQLSNGRFRYFAERESSSPDDVTLYWMQEEDAGIHFLPPPQTPELSVKWPKLRRNYTFGWPAEVAQFVGVNVNSGGRNTEESAIQFDSLSLPQVIYQDDEDKGEVHVEGATQRLMVDMSESTDQTNRALLKFSSAKGPAYVRLLIQSEDAVVTKDVPLVLNDKTPRDATVGQRLPRPLSSTAGRLDKLDVLIGAQLLKSKTGEVSNYEFAGYVSKGVLHSEEAYLNPFKVGVQAAAAGGIIPVNTAAKSENSKMTVWWFKKVSHADGLFQPFYTPAQAVSYTVKYSDKPEQLIIASGLGFNPPLTAEQAAGRLYVQNDATRIGYNPNEEHALMLGGNAYALRVDLNGVSDQSFTSQRFVLVAYTETGLYDEPARPAMRGAAVAKDSPAYPLRYDRIAGAPLVSIMPLEAMPLPLEADGEKSRNEEVMPSAPPDPAPNTSAPKDINGIANYDAFTFMDRKGQHWLYRGPHSHRPRVSLATFGVDTRIVDVTARVQGLMEAQTPIVVTTANLKTTDPAYGSFKTLTVKYQIGDVFKTVSVAENNTFTPEGIPGIKKLSMRYYYKSMEGFFVPGALVQPEPGTIMPFIAEDPQQKGKSITVDIVPRWPDDPELGGRATTVPVLNRAETLALPKRGLPQVRGQTSAQVLYQQSIANGTDETTSVKLHDPTRQKTFALGGPGQLQTIPTSVKTTAGAGRTYFQGLPPHLQSRVYFHSGLGTRGSLVFIGEFIDEVASEDYFNLNMLSGSDVEALKGLCSTSDPAIDLWKNAIDGLATTMETFRETPAGSGTYLPQADRNTVIKGPTFTSVSDPDTAVDSYALSSTGDGTGYVTLMFGNGQAFTDSGDPVVMQVIKVSDQLYRGDLKVLLSSNPLDEQVTLRHSGDYGGESADYQFEWRYAYPVDGSSPPPPQPLPGGSSGPWLRPDDPPVPQPPWANTIIVGGSPPAAIRSPAVLMGDAYFTVCYKHKTKDTTWSAWTPPMLVEGWIKRVLAKITPFNQRVTDLYNNAVNRDVSMLTQAGRRWEGDIALNLDNVNEAGLIEIYETLLNRGKSFTIDNQFNFSSTNDALLLAAGYLNDLYTLLGNEAYADAVNPTISVDDRDNIVEVNTSRYSFEGQVASSLEEELALLRGRDDFTTPGTSAAPVYNRLYWNYTRGINSGETLYAVNYNIREKTDSSAADGIVDAADAQLMFPQGHGDAYGHYLTCLKNYYKLLRHPYFTWVPRAEAVTLLGQVIQVDYKDERKFAVSAANLARTTQQIMALTHRQVYKDGAVGWSHLRDTAVKPGNTNPAVTDQRGWGLDEWGSRGAQGNYLHWVTANAMLPDEDKLHQGVQKIDRTTVTELEQLVTSTELIQTTLDSANAGLNPLGLSPGAVAFDISPTELQDGNSHYEQIYERALRAATNAKGSFDQAATMGRLLRNQELQVAEEGTAIFEQEEGFDGQLEEIYGRPYAGDIGPGKTYAQGYEGPDMINWHIIDRPTDLVDDSQNVEVELRVPVNIADFSGQALADMLASYDGTKVNSTAKDAFEKYLNATSRKPDTTLKRFTIEPNQVAKYADSEMGKRPLTGALQDALRDAQVARHALQEAVYQIRVLNKNFKREAALVTDIIKMHREKLDSQKSAAKKVHDLMVSGEVLNSVGDALESASEFIEETADAAQEAPPQSMIAGLAAGGDLTSPARFSIKLTGAVAKKLMIVAAHASRGTAAQLGVQSEKVLSDLEFLMTTLDFKQEQQQAVYELEATYRELLAQHFAMQSLVADVAAADQQVQNLIAMGNDIQKDRENYRKRAAAVISGFRVRDFTFRAFRNEALEQYHTLFNLASRYTYLAAKSYDYETGLLGTQKGQGLISAIVSSRALGDLSNDTPQATTSEFGDSGLAGVLARLNADFSVAKGRLGINNKDQNGTVFSLRHELYRIKATDAETSDEAAWQQALEQAVKPDLLTDPDVARYCSNIRKPGGGAVPGFLITFRTSIRHGENFFGLPLAGGDHAFSPSNFATKILGAGMIFKGYVGLDPFIEGQPSGSIANPDLNGANVLSATPHVYLIPCGVDMLRAPPLGDNDVIRAWTVHDQALPLPYNLGANDFNASQFFTAAGTLSEQPWILRKHRALRVVADSNFFYSSIPQEFTSSRLVGRSAWNSQWKLVIPAYTLLTDEREGIRRFKNAVKDIQLFLRTYSHSGN